MAGKSTASISQVFESEPTGVMVEFNGVVPKNAGATQDGRATDTGDGLVDGLALGESTLVGRSSL
jgi:hypothetical protein